MKIKWYIVNLKSQVWKKDKYSDIFPIRGKILILEYEL